MVNDDTKWAAHQALVDRVLTGPGQATAQQRASAFHDNGLPAPLDALVDKVAAAPTQVTDADIAAAKAAGYSEDQIFELVICAAVGASNRQYESGLAALAEATEDQGPDNAA